MKSGHNYKSGKEPVKRSAYFSDKTPKVPANQTFSGQSKKKHR